MKAMAEIQKEVLYQKFYRLKEGKIVDPVNNKQPKIEDDEDLILFQVVDANLGFNVFRYTTRDPVQHIKWFEERDEAIEFAFLQCMGEQMKIQQDQPQNKSNEKIEEFKKLGD